MVLTRQTKIFIADENILFPSEMLYPADNIIPGLREITNIIEGSMKLDELIVESTPQFGHLYSSKFECGIYLEMDLSGKSIAVYQEDNNVLHSIFLGKVDSCKTDRVGTDRTIIAYDLAYTTGSINVAPWWETFWSNREAATLKQLRDSLLEFVGISGEDVTLPNDTIEVHKNVVLSTCTFQQMLKMICELNCCFPHISRSGNMEYILIDGEETPVDLEDRYEWTNSNFEEYHTSQITGVQFFDSGDQLKYTVGEYENAYPINKNFLLYDANTTTLIDIGTTMLTRLSKFAYTPASIKMIISDMTLHLGDYVSAEGCSFYIFQNSLSGSQLIEQTIKANGDEYLYKGAAHLKYGEWVLNEKIARVIQTVEEFYTEYSDFAEDTTTGIHQTAERLEFQAGSFSNYSGNYVPTLNNSPANSWETEDQKESNENEIFYNTETKLYYRWEKINGVWGWNQTYDISFARNISSQISLEKGKIYIGTGRLEIDAQNFTLDTDGNMVAKSATLENATITSTATVGSGVNISPDEITISYNNTEMGTIGASHAQHGQGYYNTLEISGDNILAHSTSDTHIEGENTIYIESDNDIEIRSQSNLDIVSEDYISMLGDSGVQITSNDVLNIEGQGVNISAPSGSDVDMYADGNVFISSNSGWVYLTNAVIDNRHLFVGTITDYYGNDIEVIKCATI